MVGLTGKFEDIVVLVRLDDGVLFFFRGLFHHISLIKVD
jgi:hypothetical protein